jgi:DNA-binding response OmpR family regulator
MELSKQMSEQISNIRHDLFTPLNAIIGYAELLIDECMDRGLNEYIPDFKKCILATKDLIDNIGCALDPTKPGLIDAAQQHGILNEDINFHIRSSLNVIRGYSELILETAHDDGHDELIPDLNNILSAIRYFQAEVERVSILKLTGSMSVPGQATTNSIANDQYDDLITRNEDEIAINPTRICGGRILVVDDNPLNRDILARYLERLDHKVSLAENGQQALEMINANQFDLILLDILMPKLDGYQVLNRLKSEPAWRDLPVIMISSLDELDSVVRCIKIGAEDYLPKPFNPVLLNARICSCLDKKRQRDLEVEYLRKVNRITSAAAAVEAGDFNPEDLEDIAQGEDGLEQLARVFQRMANEVYQREQRLMKQVQLLQIELDEARQAKQVAEITESEYFQELQAKVQELRHIIDSP